MKILIDISNPKIEHIVKCSPKLGKRIRIINNANYDRNSFYGLIYEWVRTGVISFNTFRFLLNNVVEEERI